MKLLVRRYCGRCGLHTLTMLLMGGRWRTERTLAGCPEHRRERHCVFCCA